MAAFKFKGIDVSISVTVIVTTSYAHANEVATANSFHKIATRKVRLKN